MFSKLPLRVFFLSLAVLIAGKFGASGPLSAQEQARFDAVSIKRAKSWPLYPALDINPGYLYARAASLHFLVLQAFGIEEFQMAHAAEWMDSELYTIHAAAGKPSSSAEMMGMLRDMLSARFHLVVHRETQELPVYALTVDKNGAKLAAITEAQNESQLRLTTTGNSITLPAGSSIPEFVHYLNTRKRGVAVGLPVVDQTGLSGLYRIRLTFELTHPEGQPTVGKFSIDYFSELPKQLGLRLRQTKAPIDMLIIDSARKPDLEH